MTHRVWNSLAASVLLLSCFLFSAVLNAQQADRATITGLVTDTSGAVIPEASVTVINESTHVETAVKSTSAGVYSTPPLILGTYSVKVQKDSYGTSTQTGIALQGGVDYRQDIVLHAGTVNQTIEVKAQAQLANLSNPEVSNTLNETYYQNLPVVATQDMRLPEALLYAQSGFVPAHNSFIPQTAFMGRIAGGQAGSVESYLDGAAFGQGGNTNLTFESSPPIESIAESNIAYASFFRADGADQRRSDLLHHQVRDAPTSWKRLLVCKHESTQRSRRNGRNQAVSASRKFTRVCGWRPCVFAENL